MTTATPIRMAHDTIDRPALFLAFAWGANPWKLGFTTGAAQRPRERHVPARHIEAVREESRKAKERFGLPADAPVISCYEAGRDGCWLHRWFVPQGVANGVVDSSSLAVNRRHRRAKTDRLAGQKLRTMRLRHVAGARQVWRIVRVPSVEEEDRRQLHRAFTTAKRDRTRVINRIKGCAGVARLGDAPRQGLPPAVGAPPPVGRHPASGGTPPPSPSGVGARGGVGAAHCPGGSRTPRGAPDGGGCRHEKSATTPEAQRDWDQECLAVRAGVFRLAGFAQSAGGRRPERPDAHPLCEWQHRL